MTDKVKQLAPVIWEEVKKAKKILLHCHPSTDCDSAGSVLAIKHALTSFGKDVTAVFGDSDPKRKIPMAGLPGIDGIENKNYFEINPADFDLFLILDSSALGQISKKGDVVFPNGMSTVVIDHHASNRGFGKINLVDTSYPATCQIIYDLFRVWGLEITPDIAICLYMGIYTDTGGFKYEPVSPETLQTATELVKINPHFSKAIFTLENSNNPKQIEFLSLALSSLEHYFSNRVVVAPVSYDEMIKRDIKSADTEKLDIHNLLKSVIGWDVAVTFFEGEKDIVSVGLRTRDYDKFDLSKLAVELNGGGHKAAAGGKIYKPFDGAKKVLLDTIAKIYPFLGQP